MGVMAVEINSRTELRFDTVSQTGVREIRKRLADLNLSVANVRFPIRRGFHVAADLERRLDAVKSTMKLAYDLGGTLVTTDIGRLVDDSSDAERGLVAESVAELARHGQRVGTRLAIGTAGTDPPNLLRLLAGGWGGLVGVNFDPADLIMRGLNVEESLRTLAPHVLHFRVRDAVVDQAAGRGLEVPLGRGSLDMIPMLAILEEHNYGGYLTIEGTSDEDPVGACASSVSYLRALFE
jgi:sugar phosphate isomerase/epimerase